MGTSCYPLSPSKKQNGDHTNIEERDQLREIINGLGQCDEQDMSFITSDSGRKYFNLLNAEAPSKRSARLFEFLDMDDPIISQLLRPMLQVNPYFRPTAKELLKSKYFDDVRIP